jgi:hypothetical protein
LTHWTAIYVLMEDPPSAVVARLDHGGASTELLDIFYHLPDDVVRKELWAHLDKKGRNTLRQASHFLRNLADKRLVTTLEFDMSSRMGEDMLEGIYARLTKNDEEMYSLVRDVRITTSSDAPKNHDGFALLICLIMQRLKGLCCLRTHSFSSYSTDVTGKKPFVGSVLHWMKVTSLTQPWQLTELHVSDSMSYDTSCEDNVAEVLPALPGLKVLHYERNGRLEAAALCAVGLYCKKLRALHYTGNCSACNFGPSHLPSDFDLPDLEAITINESFGKHVVDKIQRTGGTNKQLKRVMFENPFCNDEDEGMNSLQELVRFAGSLTEVCFRFPRYKFAALPTNMPTVMRSMDASECQVKFLNAYVATKAFKLFLLAEVVPAAGHICFDITELVGYGGIALHSWCFDRMLHDEVYWADTAKAILDVQPVVTVEDRRLHLDIIVGRPAVIDMVKGYLRALARRCMARLTLSPGYRYYVYSDDDVVAIQASIDELKAMMQADAKEDGVGARVCEVVWNSNR